jgi:short-subunit dehydrogenase
MGGVPLKSIEGKTALVTGGSMGLGPYVAKFLAREGVNIALTARSEDALTDIARELTELNIKALAYPADITEHDARVELVEHVKKEFGQIDILVNNAGMEWVSSYAGLSPEFIQTMIQTNQVAPMVLTRLILPDMLARGSGHVVTMASLGGMKGSPYSATYAATKAGLIAWTSGVREELRNTGVSASVICPGFVAKAGMFAVYNKRAPKITGETTPEKVADAVILAIKKDIGRIVVNPGLVWPMQILDAIHPDIMSWVFRKFGVYAWYRGQSEENLKQRQSEKPILRGNRTVTQ